jgi:hypothetical protein
MLIGVATLTSLAAAYWIGYRAGLNDKGPQPRALVVVRRTPGDPNSLGHSYIWFDISNPQDAAKMRKKLSENAVSGSGNPRKQGSCDRSRIVSKVEERLKATKTEYFVAPGLIERMVPPVPDVGRVNSHQ